MGAASREATSRTDQLNFYREIIDTGTPDQIENALVELKSLNKRGPITLRSLMDENKLRAMGFTDAQLSVADDSIGSFAPTGSWNTAVMLLENMGIQRADAGHKKIAKDRIQQLIANQRLLTKRTIGTPLKESFKAYGFTGTFEEEGFLPVSTDEGFIKVRDRAGDFVKDFIDGRAGDPTDLAQAILDSSFLGGDPGDYLTKFTNKGDVDIIPAHAYAASFAYESVADSISNFRQNTPNLTELQQEQLRLAEGRIEVTAGLLRNRSSQTIDDAGHLQKSLDRVIPLWSAALVGGEKTSKEFAEFTKGAVVQQGQEFAETLGAEVGLEGELDFDSVMRIATEVMSRDQAPVRAITEGMLPVGLKDFESLQEDASRGKLRNEAGAAATNARGAELTRLRQTQQNAANERIAALEAAEEPSLISAGERFGTGDIEGSILQKAGELSGGLVEAITGPLGDVNVLGRALLKDEAARTPEEQEFVDLFENPPEGLLVEELKEALGVTFEGRTPGDTRRPGETFPSAVGSMEQRTRIKSRSKKKPEKKKKGER